MGQGKRVAESVGDRTWKFMGKLIDQDKETACSGIFISHSVYFVSKCTSVDWFAPLQPSSFILCHSVEVSSPFFLISSSYLGMHLFIHRFMAR